MTEQSGKTALTSQRFPPAFWGVLPSSISAENSCGSNGAFWFGRAALGLSVE